MENDLLGDFLKKPRGSGKKVKFECIQKFSEIYSIKDMCEYFNISRSGILGFCRKTTQTRMKC